MENSLREEREAFKKRARQMVAVEKRKAPLNDDSHSHKKQKAEREWTTPKTPGIDFDYKKAAGSSQYRFGILAKIVKHMRSRHQEGDTHGLTLDEILDETNQLDIGNKMKHWLQTEAMDSNPKIEKDDDGKYLFKAPYKITSKKQLLRLLEHHDRNGLGGVMMEDVVESLQNAEKIVKKLGDQVTIITRPIDKKPVLFFRDKSVCLEVDEEIQKLWNGTKVDGVDEQKIEEYLIKHGIASMADAGLKKINPAKRKKGGNRRRQQLPKAQHNEHLSDVLQDYTPKS